MPMAVRMFVCGVRKEADMIRQKNNRTDQELPAVKNESSFINSQTKDLVAITPPKHYCNPH